MNCIIPLDNAGIEAKLDKIVRIIKRIRNTMATQSDVDAIVVQLNKVRSEILAAIAALQAKIDAGQPVLDLSGLTMAVQGLDDLNPDEMV